MQHLFWVPMEFFSQRMSGDLVQRATSNDTIAQTLVGQVAPILMNLALLAFYLFVMIQYSVLLTVVGIITVAVNLILAKVISNRRTEISRAQTRDQGKLSSATLSGISMVETIKASGAEEGFLEKWSGYHASMIKASGNEQRAFSKWTETYAEKTLPTCKIVFPYSFRGPIVSAIHMLGTLWLYVIAYQNHISLAQFTAFSSAFGMAMGGISALSSSGSSFSMIRPILSLGEPILQEVPEDAEGKHEVTSLTGKIDVDQLVFRYTPDGPVILNGISLTIEPGEYVAIVGQSGCGKSTLMKILLGFEEPEKGSVYFDNYDLKNLDKRSLRRKIGTVLQDGKLFSGDIYSNITITAPWMDEDAAWEAAEIAGMAEDIRRMPMGMHTMITEGGGGISGGQKQRLLIARAVCPKPKILFMDEATSALDNLTQKTVSDSLDQMNCTRIVIAHRLSTIQQCNRIIVLDQGKIAEDGTYDELMAMNGLFTELAKRQTVEENI